MYVLVYYYYYYYYILHYYTATRVFTKKNFLKLRERSIFLLPFAFAVSDQLSAFS